MTVRERWPRGRARDGGIDRVPLRRGAMWLCGKHAVGPDPEAALTRVGATTIVCLTERHELDQRYPEYVAWLRDRGSDGRDGRLGRSAEALWFPIPDLHAPPFERARPFVAELVDRLDGGQRLLVHCGAGMGRAGTIAACVLVATGSDPTGVLDAVAAARPGAGPEVGAQQALVASFVSAVSSRPPRVGPCST